MCLKNSKPRPLPNDAPSIIPGISTIVMLLLSSILTSPITGVKVVNGYGSILGLALLILVRIVDLPAFG